MKTLTIDSYWAWAILHGSKRIENRTWPSNYRGPIAIHAGKTRKRDADAVQEIQEIDYASLATPEQADSIRGKIVAVCNMTDVFDLSKDESRLWPEERAFDERWTTGPYCFVLDDVQAIDEPIPAKGKMGFWESPT